MREHVSKVVDIRAGQRSEGPSADLEALFGEHYASLRAFIIQRAHIEGVDADDVLQDVFLKLAQDKKLLGMLAVQGQKARSYLFTMANNHIVDLYRKIQVRRRYQDTARMEEEPSVELERSVIALDQLKQVKAALMEMKTEWREAFVMNRFGRMSYREIAAHFGVTTNTVDNWMVQALVRIRSVQKKVEQEA